MGKPIGRVLLGAAVAIGGAVAIAATALTLGGAGWIIAGGLSMMLGGASEMLARKPSFSVTNRDLGQNYSDPVGALPVVYGTVRVGAHRVFVDTTGNGQYLWVVAALAHGPVAGIDDVYLDGVRALDATGRALNGLATKAQFVGYAACWKAYGTDGQLGVVPRSDARTISRSDYVDKNTRRITCSAAHPYRTGDVVAISGHSLIPDGDYPVVFYSAGTPTQFDIAQANGGGSTNNGGTVGAVDYYTPDLTALFPSQWTDAHRGRGVAYLVLRLRYDATRFPNGLPRIEAMVRGSAVEDPRTVTSLALASVAVGPAIGSYAATATLTTSAAHGLAEGAIVALADTGVAGLDGLQRVDLVLSATQFRTYVPIAAGSAGVGTATPRTHSAVPALVLRDYLTSPVYGAGLAASEIDDDAIATEASYHEEAVYVPDPPVVGAVSYPATLDLSDSTPGATYTIIRTAVAEHHFTDGDVVFISGHSVAAVNGRWTITAGANPDEFTIPVVIGAGGVGGTVQRQTTQARFACHTALRTDQSVRQCLEDLLTSCRGVLLYEGGQYRPFTRRAVTPVAFAITPDVIRGDWAFSLPAESDLANVVHASFFNAANSYQADTVDVPAPGATNAYLADDNGQLLPRDLELPCTTDRSTAQQIAQVVRRESRHQVGWAGALTEAALALRVGDVVAVTHPTPGWVAKLFWITSLALLESGEVQATGVEYDATCYDLDAPDEARYSALSEGEDQLLDPPTGLALANTAGVDTIVATWTPTGDSRATGYELQYRQHNVSDWSASVSIPGAAIGSASIPGLGFATHYDVRLRAAGINGLVSSWVEVDDYTILTGPPAVAQPPVATIDPVSEDEDSVVVRYAGTLGANGVGPLQWRRRIDGAAPGVWSGWATFPAADEDVAKSLVYPRRVLLEVQDTGTGLVGGAAFLVGPGLPLADPGTGHLKPSIPLVGGDYLVPTGDASGRINLADDPRWLNKHAENLPRSAASATPVSSVVANLTDQSQLVAGTSIQRATGDTQTVRITRGGREGTCRHAQQVTFTPQCGGTPVINLRGGVNNQPGNKWGTASQVDLGSANGAPTAGVAIYDELVALNPGPGSFVPRLRLRQKGAPTDQHYDFSGTGIVSVGGTDLSAALAAGPAANDTYTVNVKVSVSARASTLDPDPYVEIDVTYIIEVAEDGVTFHEVKRATAINADSSGSTNTSTYSDGWAISVSGMTTSGRFRIKVIAATKTGSGTTSYNIRGYVNATDGDYGVKYQTSASDKYASKTPDADDVCYYSALEVV